MPFRHAVNEPKARARILSALCGAGMPAIPHHHAGPFAPPACTIPHDFRVFSWCIIANDPAPKGKTRGRSSRRLIVNERRPMASTLESPDYCLENKLFVWVKQASNIAERKPRSAIASRLTGRTIQVNRDAWRSESGCSVIPTATELPALGVTTPGRSGRRGSPFADQSNRRAGPDSPSAGLPNADRASPRQGRFTCAVAAGQLSIK